MNGCHWTEKFKAQHCHGQGEMRKRRDKTVRRSSKLFRWHKLTMCSVEHKAVMLVFVARTQIHFCATISNLKSDNPKVTICPDMSWSTLPVYGRLVLSWSAFDGPWRFRFFFFGREALKCKMQKRAVAVYFLSAQGSSSWDRIESKVKQAWACRCFL